ncbi:hypothetical protein [Mesorhizobium sp. M7A.F.Ca.ET.027.03.2.1]|uniref:hypothetical protein n=1 Tax=Mesorhizobium sp. M7A.F.Ca.ET.027.03.2.1 TaxID=2496656 RepID=UPI000FCB661B|nr:hypothetical protein [Mesorhizobium sp. M7A.F.Ca.ET.027.03.2.1]RVD66409.1 hypothetical protein EN750_03600 [Mesorhizobium sp. M7A.F.Ca.ET.027.03.2.1]
MSDLFAVAGAAFYMGSAAMPRPEADVVAADFAAVDWTEVADWIQCGSFGDTRALISTDVINRKRTVKQKGTANAGQMQNNFAINSSDEGQLALRAAANDQSNYPFKIEWDDAPAARSFAATISIASPGVVTKVAHGLSVGAAVKIATTGALPTGLTAGTTYYVKTAPDADTFTLSTTPGGSTITTTGSQSGTHTVTTQPTGTVDYFIGLVMSAENAGGGANTVRALNSTIEINSNIVTVAPAGE